jgi:branched-chain amino acid transport system ATP-binding protein
VSAARSPERAAASVNERRRDLGLELEHVSAAYGRVRVVHDVSMTVPEGSVVALLGTNGAGKTTTLKAISGTLPPAGGRIRLDGRRIDGLSTCEIARRGITLVPEGRGVFPGLSVRDNLEIAARAAHEVGAQERDSGMARVQGIFPRLGERLDQLAGTLSGGEQQMLALSRALLASPRVLLMDEISMGLAPKIVEQLFDSVAELKAEGMTIVLVEQYLTYALRLADICYVLAKGRIAFCGEPGELRSGDADRALGTFTSA